MPSPVTVKKDNTKWAKVCDLYSSKPLNSPAMQIRLLHLAPARLGKSITGNLLKVSINPGEYFDHVIHLYEALSYTWGAASEGRSIVLNGSCTLPITDNLFRALRRLRWPLKWRLLWVDAICINEEDVRERSAQIAIMREIYQRAKAVIVWLGEPRADDIQYLMSSDRRYYVQLISALTRTEPKWYERVSKLKDPMVMSKRNILPRLYVDSVSTFNETLLTFISSTSRHG